MAWRGAVGGGRGGRLRGRRLQVGSLDGGSEVGSALAVVRDGDRVALHAVRWSGAPRRPCPRPRRPGCRPAGCRPAAPWRAARRDLVDSAPDVVALVDREPRPVPSSTPHSACPRWSARRTSACCWCRRRSARRRRRSPVVAATMISDDRRDEARPPAAPPATGSAGRRPPGPGHRCRRRVGHRRHRRHHLGVLGDRRAPGRTRSRPRGRAGRAAPRRTRRRRRSAGPGPWTSPGVRRRPGRPGPRAAGPGPGR